MDAEYDLTSAELALWELPEAAVLAHLRSAIQTTPMTCLRHPHGFFVMLLNRTPQEEWRVHLWPEGERIISGMPARIHTHESHVNSRLLKGKLTNVNYHVREVSTGGHPLYEVSYRGDKYVKGTTNLLRRTGTRLHLEEATRLELIAGDRYMVERHTFHEAIVPANEVTITLICLHGHEAGLVKVVGVDGHPEEIQFERTDVHPHDLLYAF
ncbi:hypothetical protein C7534_101567 [Pseudomonas sp. OV226]|nr:hypothetical protein C7534_101567 [Pseudomonas sp. OV226]